VATSRRASSLLFFLGFLALVLALHLPMIKFPFHWDEMGQFAPASLDLYQDGSLVAHSTLPNVHPPGVMAIVALTWRIFGVSVVSVRVAMLVVASAGLLFSFLLAIRLCRGTAGAPAFAAVLLLMASPIFFSQSEMILLDMPAMTFTALALLLFIDERYAACAAACTALVLIKETSITTPMVFGAWLLFRERRIREALYFFAPAIALGAWLVLLHHKTGYWLGNEGFASDNVSRALKLQHILEGFAARFHFLFIADGRFIGLIALFAGFRMLRGKNWQIAALVAIAQVVVVTVFGYAMLERYLIPVLPILYAAVAAAASVYPTSWRWVSHTAMLAMLVIGWFVNPPYPFSYENNLAWTDFVALQKEAANYLEAYYPDKRILSSWPFPGAIQHPYLGYVERPLVGVELPGYTIRVDDIKNFDPNSYDLLVAYSKFWTFEGHFFDNNLLRPFIRQYLDYHPQATEDEIKDGTGMIPVHRWERGGQWIEIFRKPKAASF
jgi:4-amino-4-deoxy-L-arabinose transferase-like glycosyltransferase